MPRFVVLHHDWPSEHYDLMLEADGVLKTWRLAAEPLGDVAAELIADHRLIYLDYEGPVSRDRGRVTRWDSGILTWLTSNSFFLHGEKIYGEYVIENGILKSRERECAQRRHAH